MLHPNDVYDDGASDLGLQVIGNDCRKLVGDFAIKVPGRC